MSSLQSTVSIAKVGTNSVRATIPEGIVAFLGLEAGDKLDWKMEVTDDGERIILVKKYDADEVEKIIRKYKKKK
ncbi:MAG TPA: AbrB/MazE/SpoVT family DNA-binding domain-containing protein [Candidatus Nitrosotalea sp.]|nr:AbrB/MazE/SpoVT family DNA-binding domain-containing protein [Candidatus Nitrosotalea sp.]